MSSCYQWWTFWGTEAGSWHERPNTKAPFGPRRHTKWLTSRGFLAGRSLVTTLPVSRTYPNYGFSQRGPDRGDAWT